MICGMNFHYMRHPLRRFLDDAADIGLTRIELWGAAPHFFIGDRTLADARALGQDIRARGLSLVCFTPEQCVYPINIASAEADLRDRSIRYFFDSLEMSAEMGSPALLVTPGSGYADESAEPAFARCVDALGMIADRASRLGITLFLEALPPAWSNVARTASELRSLLDAVASPVLLGMVDTAGARVTGETVQDYVAALGDRLGHVHMLDSDPAGSHLAWGDGSLSAEDCVATLRAAGYEGALSIELTNSRYYLEPGPAMRISAERLGTALDATGLL